MLRWSESSGIMCVARVDVTAPEEIQQLRCMRASIQRGTKKLQDTNPPAEHPDACIVGVLHVAPLASKTVEMSPPDDSCERGHAASVAKDRVVCRVAPVERVARRRTA